MKRTPVAILVAGLIAGCSSGGTAAPQGTRASASTGTGVTTLGKAEAARALEDAVTLAVASTGRFSQALTFGAAFTEPMTWIGSYDTDAGLWQCRLRAQDPTDESISEVRIIGTTEDLYLTSPQWTGRQEGRYLRFGAADIAKATATVNADIDLSAGMPLQVSTLTLLEAISGVQDETETRIQAELPAADAVSLANLKSGLLKLKVRLEDLTGTAKVTVTLDRGNNLKQVLMEAGALEGVAGLPGQVQQLVEVLATYVDYSAFGDDVVIRVPRESELTEPQSD